MIKRFKNDDDGYENWRREEGGFIYNNFGGHNINYKKLHTSICKWLDIGRPRDKKTSVEKICCANINDLITWLGLKGMEYSFCPQCKPEANSNTIQGVQFKPLSSNGDLDPQKVVKALIEYRNRLKSQKFGGTWTGDEVADKFLRDNPFAFLMAASIDRGAVAEGIWKIPHFLFQTLSHLDPRIIVNYDVKEIENLLRSLDKKPRFPKQAATTILSLATMVVSQFNGNAENIWKKREPGAVLHTLIKIWGVGPGIAHMIVRILVDEFDYDPGPSGFRQINVKADVQLKKVFYRTGLVDREDDKLCVRAACELHPEYPGLLDWPAWEIGRRWCDKNNPNCTECPLDHVCLHRLV